MKINYEFIKQILTTMAERESHFISTLTLINEIKTEFQTLDNEEFTDYFFGHLQLLNDSGFICQLSENKNNLGIAYGHNGNILLSDCYIRLTSKGYDFIKASKEKNFIEKLKKYTLTESIKITEAVLINGISHSISSFIA